MNVRAFMVSVALLVLAVAVAADIVAVPSESAASRVARTRIIRVGYAWEPPYAFRDARGRVTGESPEVARAVLDQLGVRRIEWIQTDFASLIPGLLAGRFDMIAAGMFIEPDRVAQVVFTAPTACIEPALLVRSGNPLALHRLEDIAAESRARLAVLRGAVEGGDARMAGIPRDRVVAYATVDQAAASLAAGLVDAVALSGPTVQWFAEHEPALERAQPFVSGKRLSGCAGFAFRPADAALSHDFNRVLAEFIGSRPHAELVRPFGFSRENLPLSTAFPTVPQGR